MRSKELSKDMSKKPQTGESYVSQLWRQCLCSRRFGASLQILEQTILLITARNNSRFVNHTKAKQNTTIILENLMVCLSCYLFSSQFLHFQRKEYFNLGNKSINFKSCLCYAIKIENTLQIGGKQIFGQMKPE